MTRLVCPKCGTRGYLINGKTTLDDKQCCLFCTDIRL